MQCTYRERALSYFLGNLFSFQKSEEYFTIVSIIHLHKTWTEVELQEVLLLQNDRAQQSAVGQPNLLYHLSSGSLIRRVKSGLKVFRRAQLGTSSARAHKSGRDDRPARPSFPVIPHINHALFAHLVANTSSNVHEQAWSRRWRGRLDWSSTASYFTVPP